MEKRTDYSTDDITVIDDFLKPERYSKLLNSVLSNSFHWTVGPSLTDNVRVMERKYDMQMVRMFYREFEGPDMEIIKMIAPLLSKLGLNSSKLIRVKANLVPCKHEHMLAGWHTDVSPSKFGNSMTAIYYVNGTNGSTHFRNGDIIEGKGNRIVIFPSSYEHSACYHTDHLARCVINFNWFLDK